MPPGRHSGGRNKRDRREAPGKRALDGRRREKAARNCRAEWNQLSVRSSQRMGSRPKLRIIISAITSAGMSAHSADTITGAPSMIRYVAFTGTRHMLLLVSKLSAPFQNCMYPALKLLLTHLKQLDSFRSTNPAISRDISRDTLSAKDLVSTRRSCTATTRAAISFGLP